MLLHAWSPLRMSSMTYILTSRSLESAVSVLAQILCLTLLPSSIATLVFFTFKPDARWPLPPQNSDK